MIEQYLGQFTRTNNNIHAKGARLKRMKAICAQLQDLFESIDNFNIVSVGYEDCVKAQKGKTAMIQKIEQCISDFACHSNMYEL